MTDCKHTISEISQLSGVTKESLRIWERRYGFPNPQRSEQGDRQYSRRDLEKLILIKQLTDSGRRPGKLINLDTQQLRELRDQQCINFDTRELISRLSASDTATVQAWMVRLLEQYGLRQFVHHILVPSTRAVGEAWQQGQLAVYQEHLYTEIVTRVVRNAMSAMPEAGSEPRIILTTVPGEMHSLGLLMVEALLRLSGATAMSFGTEMPFADIRNAAVAYDAQVIALSFSANIESDHVLVLLSGLRQMIDQHIQIWVGGGALSHATDLPEGVLYLPGLVELEQVVAAW